MRWRVCMQVCNWRQLAVCRDGVEASSDHATAEAIEAVDTALGILGGSQVCFPRPALIVCVRARVRVCVCVRAHTCAPQLVGPLGGHRCGTWQ